MSTAVLKLFAGQGTGRTDGQSGDYMLPHLGSIIKYITCSTFTLRTIWQVVF